ncbi:MAG TPA: GNAT family N-acetyltransferase [Candidatus Limnocylindria bacterium]|nr:GNAT family N-acetyltransferase [Candidatus Limnocylindria bacterium]
MTVLERDLVYAIESSLHVYPAVPGLTTDLAVPGVQGRMTALSHPLANLVGMARLDEETADATIQRISQRYAREHKAFGWVVGPGTTPGDMKRRLERTGMHTIAHLAGMALTDLDIPIEPNPAARIREITPDEAAAHSDMMGRAYGMPDDVAEMFARLLAAGPVQSRGYFAYLDTDAPVAWSYLVYLPSSPIVLLGGAATLPEVRGKGIYSALVKRRLDDARADGREAAVIQADRDTSAPICAKLGFRELCSLEVLAWSPESRAGR